MTGDPGWDRLAGAFEELVQLPNASRPAALDRLASGHPAFRSRLEAMLAADAATAHPLDRDIGETAGDLLGRTPEAPSSTATLSRAIFSSPRPAPCSVRTPTY